MTRDRRLRHVPWLLVCALLAVAAPAAFQEEDDNGPPVTAAVQVTRDPNPSRAHASPASW